MHGLLYLHIGYLDVGVGLHAQCKGRVFLSPDTRFECFLGGVKIFAKNLKGCKNFGENLREFENFPRNFPGFTLIFLCFLKGGLKLIKVPYEMIRVSECSCLHSYFFVRMVFFSSQPQIFLSSISNFGY